jgi:hypothetical protein
MRPQWRAPESKPLQLTEKNTVELAARPRAIIASFGMVALLGFGAVTALTVENTSGLQAEAETQSAPVAQKQAPEVASPQKIADATQAVYQPAKEVVIAQQDPARQSQAQPAPAPQLAPIVVLQSETRALNHDDPRWARVAEPAHATVSAAPRQEASAASSYIMAFADPMEKPVKMPKEAQSPGDQVITAAIPKTAPVPENAARDEVQGAKPVQRARIRTAVNMRSGPADEARVIGVVPTNATVNLVKCSSWCEIVFKDRRGWIYKGFIK